MKLNQEQELFLIEKLALKDDYSKIKREFDNFFETKITGEEIIRFKANNIDEIKKISAKELAAIDKEPLAHARIRLKKLNEFLEEALTPRVVRSVPKFSNGKEIEYELVYEKDLALANQIMKTAQNEEFFFKKLFLSAKIADIELEDAKKLAQTGFKVISVNNGLKEKESNVETPSS